MTASPRYSALDILRGLSIMGMILVNNPGTWGVAFKPLQHVRWEGCTVADLVFPFFVFIMGVAMVFSFGKRGTTFSFRLLGKILFRGSVIFAIGLALNAFPFHNPDAAADLSFWDNFMAHCEHVRVFGVFQRLAMCYVLGALLILILRNTWVILVGMVGLIALHWYLLVHLGDAQLGVFTLAGQGSGAIDEALVGIEHVYRGYGLPFDPEGVLGSITGAASVLLGFLAGQIIRKADSQAESVARLYSMGLVSLLVAYFLSFELPVVKALWTGSYVLETGGWGMICLAFLIYFADMRGKGQYLMPLKAMGLNPLFAYIVADLLAKCAVQFIKWTTAAGQEVTLHGWYYTDICVKWVGESGSYSSLLYASSFVLVIMIPCLILYKLKLVIKI